jgi:hypothetical protein
MKVPLNMALGMQDHLRVFTYDCYCADALLSGLTQSTDSNPRWQLAVDTMYRFLTCGLLWSPSLKEKNPAVLQGEYRKYCELLSNCNPFSANSKDFIPWRFWDLCPTDLCRKLISQHKIREMQSSTINQDFILELEKLFEEYSVAWQDEPLIPIKH